MENQATSRKAEGGMLTGIFSDKDSTENAYKTLRDRGYSESEINVIMSDKTRDQFYKNDPDSEIGNKAAEGTGIGGAIGGTLGAIIGGVAAIGTNLVLPGLGLIVWGPVAAALAGAGAGGLTGGLVGALVGWGIPEEQAKHYEKGIGEGGTVIGVTPKSQEDSDYFQNEWKTKHNAQHIYS
ncbi:MAG: hypothetical protein IPM21_16675 [Acidobacteria bacterium]|nr:hypothetical protein [Acidobacteriota bacterium]